MNNGFRTKWGGLLSCSQWYLLPVYFATCSWGWAANDTILVNGSELTLENLALANESNSTFIIEARQNASLTAKNLHLNSSGVAGGGILVLESHLDAQGGDVNVSGSGTVLYGIGVHLARNSRATISDMTITGEGHAHGLVVDGLGLGTGAGMSGWTVADVTNATIATESGNAVFARASELTLTNVSASTQGDYSYAVAANGVADAPANVVIEGGNYTTHGTGSHGIWIIDSAVTLNNARVTTYGNRASAISAAQGPAFVTNSIFHTEGSGAYGLYSESLVDADGVSITTSGTTGAGMFAARGGEGRLKNSSITTSGVKAPGLLAYPGSTITASNVTIDTSGKDGFGLWSYVGTLNVSDSRIATTGEAASGLYVNGSTASGLTNTVRLDNVTLSSAQAQAIEVNATGLSLSVTDSVLTGGNGQLMTVKHREDEVNPGNYLYSDVTFDTVNSTLNGDIVTTGMGNRVAVNLASGSVLTGAVTQVTTLEVDDSSRWNMNNSSTVGQLTNNGTIAFSDTNKFDALTVAGNYAGDGGLLVMNSILGDDHSPVNKLIVGGDVLQGTTRVAVNNLGGHGAETIEGIEIVDVGGTSIGNFVKSGRIVAGAYDYDLVQKGQSWYLTNGAASLNLGAEIVRPEGASYVANLAASNTLFMMTLRDRLGEPRFIDALSEQPEATSLWLRLVGGHNQWRDDSGQLKTQGNRYVAQLGGDVARWSADGADRWHVGFMAGYGNSRSKTDSDASGYSSKGYAKGYSVGSYATWQANAENQTGAWLDSWLQYSWFNNSVSGENLAAESYKSHGFTASLEAGYTWKLGEFAGSQGTVNTWFVEPQAQAVWMGVRADAHREANNTLVQGEGDGNWMTRLGIKTWLNSHHARDNGKQREFQPWIALSWLHNTRHFAANMDDARVSQDGATNLAEVKVGLEGQIHPRLNVWGNVGVQVGDTGYNDTAAMLGMKYNF